MRVERARDELDAVTAALASAFGLGGRARKAGDPAERARSAVTWRIRSALSKVEAAHPALGAHLRTRSHRDLLLLPAGTPGRVAALTRGPQRR